VGKKLKDRMKKYEDKVMKILKYRAEKYNTENEAELIEWIKQDRNHLKQAIEETINDFKYWYDKDFLNIDDINDIDAVIGILGDNYNMEVGK
jgi:hypothetical protein